MRSPTAASATLLALTLAGATARAQESPTEIARRDLITRAEAAATAGDHAQAVDLAARAAQIRVTPTIHYFLAREHLALGHPVEALGFAGSCARAAEADASLRNRDSIIQACREIVATSDRLVGRLRVDVADPLPPSTSVRVREAELPPPLYGVPYPVVPGTVVIEASAPGQRPLHFEVRVEPGHTTTVAVRLEAEPAHSVAPRARAPQPAPVTTPGPGVGPWIVAGGGVAALALSGVFYGLAMGARNERDAACVGGCVPAAQGYDDTYAGDLTVANVAIAVGATAVIGGAVWYVVRRLRPRDTRSASLRWELSPVVRGLTMGVGGSF